MRKYLSEDQHEFVIYVKWERQSLQVFIAVRASLYFKEIGGSSLSNWLIVKNNIINSFDSFFYSLCQYNRLEEPVE